MRKFYATQHNFIVPTEFKLTIKKEVAAGQFQMVGISLSNYHAFLHRQNETIKKHAEQMFKKHYQVLEESQLILHTLPPISTVEISRLLPNLDTNEPLGVMLWKGSTLTLRWVGARPPRDKFLHLPGQMIYFSHLQTFPNKFISSQEITTLILFHFRRRDQKILFRIPLEKQTLPSADKILAIWPNQEWKNSGKHNDYAPLTAEQGLRLINKEWIIPGKELGQGAFGKVMSATLKPESKLPQNQEYAIKQIVLNENIDIPWQEELLIHRDVESKFTVRLYGIDFKIEPSSVTLLMILDKIGQGRDLRSIISQGHCRNEHVARFYLACMIEGLLIIHQAGYVHGDLKPENILINSWGYCILADYGISSRIREKGGKFLEPHMVKPNGFTPQFNPPERILVENASFIVTFAQDWWGIGFMFYSLLTGLFFTHQFPHEYLTQYEDAQKKSSRYDFLMTPLPGANYVWTSNSENYTDQHQHKIIEIRNQWRDVASKLNAVNLLSLSDTGLNLLARLLHPNPHSRIGSLTSENLFTSKLDEIRTHPWFDGFDWLALQNQTMLAPNLLPNFHSKE